MVHFRHQTLYSDEAAGPRWAGETQSEHRLEGQVATRGVPPAAGVVGTQALRWEDEALGTERGKGRVWEHPVLLEGPGMGPHIALSPQVDVQLQVAVPQPGPYALVMEYANKDARQEVDVAVHTPQRAPQQGVLTLHPCPYRCVGSG